MGSGRSFEKRLGEMKKRVWLEYLESVLEGGGKLEAGGREGMQRELQ